ncbi:5-oxoprolinase subunit PxpB [Chitinilyticum litopenaei]|uniref:5-oxoprolinase subunit PxpB n=1 Tax=Chitinilyticum litopenaei TaxID=1121276 RepID=UPI00048F6FB6|nr:5-oxoprolinase subunit PxpB [Chitinilyticum litopenaei]
MTMAIVAMGEGMLLLQTAPELACQQRLWALEARLRRRHRCCVLGMYSLAVRFDPLQEARGRVEAMLVREWEKAAPDERAGARHHRIPVRYGGADGPDLAELAALCGLSVPEVIALHAGTPYRVYCLGFLPGFPYLGGLDPRLAAPRRATPRLRVPAGSVGIGGAQTGIYPQDAPGGWQLIGRSAVPLFNPQHSPAALLQPGDWLHFEPEAHA